MGQTDFYFEYNKNYFNKLKLFIEKCIKIKSIQKNLCLLNKHIIESKEEFEEAKNQLQSTINFDGIDFEDDIGYPYLCEQYRIYSEPEFFQLIKVRNKKYLFVQCQSACDFAQYIDENNIKECNYIEGVENCVVLENYM